MKQQVYKCIILGSLWGITEATVGYFLHKITLGIGWMFWFPIAFFFINTCYRWTKSPVAVLLTAMLASSLKLINLFFTVRYDMVFNPAVSILLEALSAMLVFTYLAKRQMQQTDSLGIAGIGFLWRILYLCYVLFLPAALLQISPLANSPSLVKFLFLETAVNTVIISLCMKATTTCTRQPFHTIWERLRLASNNNRMLKPSFSATAFCLAIVVQLMTV